VEVADSIVLNAGDPCGRRTRVAAVQPNQLVAPDVEHPIADHGVDLKLELEVWHELEEVRAPERPSRVE
jgi:hypothetical protein